MEHVDVETVPVHLILQGKTVAVLPEMIHVFLLMG